jgi:hypothetical protein
VQIHYVNNGFAKATSWLFGSSFIAATTTTTAKNSLTNYKDINFSPHSSILSQPFMNMTMVLSLSIESMRDFMSAA